MAIQMTRAEYEAKYGVKPPVASTVSDLDTTPAPVMMTREEYNAKYRPQPTEEEKRKDDWRYKVGDFLVNKTPIGLITKPFEAAKAGVERFKTGYGQLQESMENKPIGEKAKMLGFGMLNIGASVPEVLFSPVTGAVSWGAGLPGIKQTIEGVDKYLIQPTAEKISENPYVQSFAKSVPQTEAESLITLGALLFGAKKGEQIKQPIEGAIREAEYTVMGGGPEGKTGIIPAAQQQMTKFQQARSSAATTKLVDELGAIESNYSTLRKAQTFEGDAGQASRQRIADAHITAGILDGAIDVDGTIRTTQKGGPVDRYYAQTLDGAEGVVRQNLAREGKTINIEQVRNEMLASVDKQFEGAELTAAINGVERELAGLAKRADEFGNIELAKIQDAKINTTKNVNYRNDGNATIAFKKLKGNTYKRLIENNSEVSVTVNGKTYKIPDINKELGKYYSDIERLQSLDGRKVKGGRLGKYVAQLSGTLIGGAAGTIFGGPGAAAGGILGGEAASVLKGQDFMRRFGRGGEGVIPKNPILEQAIKEGRLPPTVNLRESDPKVSAPSSIPKTREIIEVEARIKKNVEDQKKAIKAGDFGLVASLKVVYQALVSKLKDLIRKIKETPNKQGGFIKNPLNQSYKEGSRNTQYNKTNTKTTTPIDSKSTTKTLQKSIDDTISNNIDELIDKADKSVINGRVNIDDLATLEKIKEDVIKGNLTHEQRLSFNEIAKRVGREDLIPQLKTSTKAPVKSSLIKTQELSQILRGTKGMTADDIMATYPDIKLKKDVPATDIYGNKVKIPEGEVLTPYELKGNKILLQDGETYIVSKAQFQNIKGQSVSKEVKEFAPELKGLEESVKKVNQVGTTEKGKPIYAGGNTKYESYQLPDGNNYKEILIKAPESNLPTVIEKRPGLLQDADVNGRIPLTVDVPVTRKAPTFKSSHWDEPNVISHLRMNERTYNGKKVAFMEELQSDWAREGRSKGFISDEKLNQSEYDALSKKINDAAKKYQTSVSTVEERMSIAIEDGLITQSDLDRMKILNEIKYGVTSKVPNNPLLKNWQELSIKRALKEAVDNDAEYFAWINGGQTSARYNLATHVDNVKWDSLKSDNKPGKNIGIFAEQGKNISLRIDENGVITNGYNQRDWEGKKLDEVLGKGLADKIMEKESGTLSGEGLKFGGEWANNLYDKQVGNIVSDLTGAKVEKLDLGLPIEKVKTDIFAKVGGGFERIESLSELKVGQEITRDRNLQNKYIITDILGDGKFKAVPKQRYEQLKKLTNKDFGKNASDDFVKRQIDAQIQTASETFDISQKLTTQQGIKLTPEIKAKIRGEAPSFKASGKQFEANKGVADNLTTSIKQAKASGQSFDEWVKGQGDEILHGTDKKFTDFDKTKIGLNEPDSRNNSAFYFTDSLDTAKSYGKNIVKRYGKFEKPITLDAEGKSYIDFRENLIDAMEKAKKGGNDVVIIKNLSDRKDWGNYEPATHYAVIDTNKLKTLSQLKAEWNKIK